MTIIRDALGSAKDAQYSGLSISHFKLLSGFYMAFDPGHIGLSFDPN